MPTLPDKDFYFDWVWVPLSRFPVRMVGEVTVPPGMYILQGAFSGRGGMELVWSWLIGLAILLRIRWGVGDSIVPIWHDDLGVAPGLLFSVPPRSQVLRWGCAPKFHYLSPRWPNWASPTKLSLGVPLNISKYRWL